MTHKIKVHEKALAHLSRGLYRSPASALRELVSNAWDANAQVVRIDTNYPNFYQLVVEDDGDGFTKEEFHRVMSGGIGNSEKRNEDHQGSLKWNRQTIGRLGIGILGIAQIALGFTVTSRTADGQGFRAHVKLYDLLKDKLDRDDSEVVQREEIDIGAYEFDDNFDPKHAKRGTTIMTNALHPQFTKAFQDSVVKPQLKEPVSKRKGASKPAEFIEVPTDWKKAVGILSEKDSLQLLGDYWRLLWELAASAPVRYIDSAVVPSGMIRNDQQKLTDYRFRLIVDGIELFKPIDLRNDKMGFITRRLDFSKKIYGKQVSAHGYIAVRDGLQIRPDELRGLMIRIKNIGIGYYDQTLLDFRVNQGPRSRWLTGEIYVDEGLEDALNVDRDSFNRFHPHFRAIQGFVHDTLKKDIFPKVYVNMDRRSERRAIKKDGARNKHIDRTISEAVDSPVTVRVQRKTENIDQAPRAHVKRAGNEVEVVLPNANNVPTKKAYRQFAAAILGIFEVAMQEPTLDRRREKFSALLMKLFSEW